MRVAFKEWSIICDALATGRQVIILRKGGISEGPGGFKIDQPEFLLFPTLFHQQRESVIPEAQSRFDQIQSAFPPSNILRVETICRVAAWHRLDTLEKAQRLESQHIWRPEVIAERFEWGRDKAIFALAVRAFQLPKAIELPMASSYGGCKSWIELESEVDVSEAKAVVDDESFNRRLTEFQDAVD